VNVGGGSSASSRSVGCCRDSLPHGRYAQGRQGSHLALAFQDHDRTIIVGGKAVEPAGIFDLDGDTLRVLRDRADRGRPKGFPKEARAGTITLKRENQ
jgi:hypothetical protein